MGLYEKASLYVGKPEFRRWQDNPEQPRDWNGAADFLGLTGGDSLVDPVQRLEAIRTTIQAALDWCTARDTEYLTSGSSAGSPIHVSDLASVLDFLVALTYRFPEALEKKGRPHRFFKPPEKKPPEKRDEQKSDEEPFWDWD
jgi:hypothetical protein